MTTNTLKITFRQVNDHRDAARERLRRAEAGETGDAIEQDARFILNFEDFDEVEMLMRTSNLSLLEAIVDKQPESIRQVTTVVDRDYKEVHRNLEELEALGVIEFEQNGASKKPILRGGADSINFSFNIGRGAANDQTGASA